MQCKRMLQFPDINKSLVVTILLDENQKKNIKLIESYIKETISPKKLRFIMMSESLPENMLQSDYMVVVMKDDFNKLGLLNKEKVEILKRTSDDLFVNLSNNNHNLMNDYIVSFVDSSFKVGHSKANMEMHDLIIDYGDEMNDIERLKIIYKYLLMLSGNKNEN